MAIYNIFTPKGYKIRVHFGRTVVDEGEYQPGKPGFDQKLVDEFLSQFGWDALIKTLKICTFQPGTQVIGFQVMAVLMSCKQ